MLKVIPNLAEHIVGVAASGEVTTDDYKDVMEPLLEKIHREGKKIRFLYHFTPEFKGFTVGGAWEDFNIGMRHMRLFESCAIVTDVEWLRKSSEIGGALLPTTVKVFHQNEYNSALDWLATRPDENLQHTLHADKNVLEVEPSGPLKKSDFDALAFTIDPWLEAHGRLNGIVIHAKEFPGWKNFGSMLKHFQFIREHHTKVKKVALAADGHLAELAPKIAEHFVNAEVKNFDYKNLNEAIDWASH